MEDSQSRLGSLQAHMLGCSRKCGGSAKNICIMKKKYKKKNIYMNKIKNKKVFLFTKQRRFHQVKVTSPFLLNKMMATPITK